MRTIFHLDLDAFFVSVERLLDPSLEGKPVIVGANPETGRGVVAACSYEARAFGLHSAMPINQAFKLCPKGVYISGHHSEYGKFSKEVKKILEKYAPMLEQASVDEFYLDFSGTSKMYGHPYQFAQKLQSEIWKQLHLPCSIGIATNKTIAKICSDFMKPRGISYVIPGMEKEFLANLPAGKMPGIGKVTLQSLNSKGFYTLGDISKMTQDYFAAAFGKHGIDIWEKANGKGSEYLNPPTEQKSISKERTYRTDVTDKEEIEATLFKLTGQVCQMLRDRNWQASTISIKLRYSDFETLTRAKTVKPTSDDKTVYDVAVELFRKAYTRRVAIRLIGIHLTKFTAFGEQELLFENEEVQRKKMFNAVTNIRNKFGFDAIQFGNSKKK